MHTTITKKGLARTVRGGFTLVEMMVSISIFVIVAFVVTGTLISVSNANRKAQELRQVMDNLNLSIQSMVLRMREGTRYSCYDNAGNSGFSNLKKAGDLNNIGLPCGSNGGEAIAFLDPTPAVAGGEGTLVKYYLGTVGEGSELKHILKAENLALSLQVLDVTSPEVDINSLNFRVGNVSGSQTGLKPYVIISISGTAKLRNGGDTNFNLQTFVSQHN